MKKYEYKMVDLSPTARTLNNNKKMKEMVDRLNELGKEGWLMVEGVEFTKYAIFVREILD